MGNQPDVIDLAYVYYLFHVRSGKCDAVAKLRMFFILIIEIYAKDQGIYTAWSQFVFDEFYKSIYIADPGCSNAKAAYWDGLISATGTVPIGTAPSDIRKRYAMHEDLVTPCC